MARIRGYDFKQIIICDSYNRRALHYKNQIITNLKMFGLTEDDIDVPLESSITWRKEPACASWYLWNEYLFFSYNGSAKFVENLAMVSRVIEHFIKRLAEGEITKAEFLELFVEEHDVLDRRKAARDVLCVEEDSMDFETMHRNFKKLSKKYHPDMPKGDSEQFKMINDAHKLLKKELC